MSQNQTKPTLRIKRLEFEDGDGDGPVILLRKRPALVDNSQALSLAAISDELFISMMGVKVFVLYVERSHERSTERGP